MGVIYQIIGDYLSDNWGVFISWLGITYHFTLGIYFVLPRIEYLLMVGVEHHQNWSCTMKMPGQRALQLGQVFAPAWPLVPQRKKRRRHDNRTSRTSVVSEVLPLKKSLARPRLRLVTSPRSRRRSGNARGRSRLILWGPWTTQGLCDIWGKKYCKVNLYME